MDEFRKALKNIIDIGAGIDAGIEGETAPGRKASLYDTGGGLIDLEESSFEHAEEIQVHLLPQPSSAAGYLQILHRRPITSSSFEEVLEQKGDGCSVEEEEMLPCMVVDVRYDLALTLSGTAGNSDTETLCLELSAYVVSQEDQEVESGPNVEEGFPQVTPLLWFEHRSFAAETEVSSALGPGPAGELLTDIANIPVTRSSMRTLRPGNWLNDEVINVFIELLRKHIEATNLPKIYITSTLLYAKLVCRGYQFSRVARWTKNCDFRQIRRVIIPLHIHGNHWVVAIIDLMLHTFEYYDSLAGDAAHNAQQLNADGRCIYDHLMRWLVNVCAVAEDEVKSFTVLPSSVPKQLNGCDCGVFMLCYALCRAMEIEPHFKQEDIAGIRRQMVWDILNKQLSIRHM